MTTIDATRQLAVWIDTWDKGKDGEIIHMPTPPIGVPVPVKTGNAAPAAPVPPAPRPPATVPSDMLDMSQF